MLDKSKVDTELARRFCAAFVSYQLTSRDRPLSPDRKERTMPSNIAQTTTSDSFRGNPMAW